MHQKIKVDSFCLIEMRIFHVVKLSYLIVGHTHEDVDQYFSVISRFFRKLIMCIYSIGGFISALMACFKTPGCIPKCVEQICYCYDTSSLAETFEYSLIRNLEDLIQAKQLATKSITLFLKEIVKERRLCSTSTSVTAMLYIPEQKAKDQYFYLSSMAKAWS